jgi:hypothetical protein
VTWLAVDPHGRVVVLTLSAMEHVVRRGRPLSANAILEVVERPVAITPDPHPSGRRERYHARDARGRAIRVVVEFSEGAGVIVTAFPDRRYRPQS